MKRIGFVGVSLLCLLPVSIGYFRHQKRVQNGYPVRLYPATHDLGEVRWGNILKYTFRLVNTSHQEVVIERIDTSCGCTAVEASSHRLRPSERGSVTVWLNPTGFVGKMENVVHLYLQGFQQPATFHIQADVNPLLVPSLPVIDFGRVKPGKRVSTTITLRNSSGQQVQVTRLHSSVDYIHARLLSSVHDRHPVIAISLIDPPVGRLYARLSVQTSLQERSQIDIPIRADVPCKWRLSDQEFFFGFVNRGQQLSRQVVVWGLPPASVIRTWTDVPGASARTTSHISSSETRVIVRLDLSNAHEGPLTGSVFVETKDKEQGLLRIPVVGSVQDPSKVTGCCR